MVATWRFVLRRFLLSLSSVPIVALGCAAWYLGIPRLVVLVGVGVATTLLIVWLSRKELR